MPSMEYQPPIDIRPVTGRADVVPGWEPLFADIRAAEQRSNHAAERGFAPAIEVMNRFVRRQGDTSLPHMVLSPRG